MKPTHLLSAFANWPIKCILILLLACMLGACATGSSGGRWEKVVSAEQEIIVEEGGFSVTAPLGWMRANFVINDGRGNSVDLSEQLLLTRDGLPLNSINIYRLEHEGAFENVEKDSSADMLPSELARLYLADLKAGGNMENLKTLKNRPAKFGGGKGFFLHLQIKMGDGLRLERKVYGMTTEKGVYLLEYTAPSLHYFAQGDAAFKTIVLSFERIEIAAKE